MNSYGMLLKVVVIEKTTSDSALISVFMKKIKKNHWLVDKGCYDTDNIIHQVVFKV